MMNTFISPIKIHFGEGSIQKISDECAALGVDRVIVFADPFLVTSGAIKRIEHVLTEQHIQYSIYDNIVPEPPLSAGDAAVEAVRASKAQLVIAAGGGSALDMAKAAAVLALHDGKISDYLNLTGTKKLEHKGLPKILIPTTAGTGSEVTDIAVFTLESSKDVITHHFLLADAAIIDPEFTYSVPARVTAATGVDAFTHALEAYTSIQSSTLTDTLALEAVTLIAKNIRKAVWQGHDKEARRAMAWGSTIAGLAFFNAGTAGVHGLAYPLGGLFHISHGESNALMLPYVYEFILPACIDKMEKVAFAMGVGTKTASTRDNALSALQAIRDLTRDVGIPSSLSAYGIKAQDIDSLADDAIKQTRLLNRSPKALNIDDIRNIYQRALEG
ncbi:iron-containing alcohol dehydrogenase [Paenibacillus xerothermodurans]|uniref:Iron-containing alcohol dehydrogenase n=1 Tax=Paenibacillus xerothermodurans TaxID=1977292 RepID=A0A2W1NDG1_PAEXE|nr:iron-containing alcohol dehydrogenase [Paenibacillus xerothermodurans]PZE22739.1 iron-containing alcohol dehydrogenase [Paenibacillus xerothermodurans]